MTSPTLDCLNQHRAPRLEDLILAEVFLAGGPCYIHRLWAEMYERKRSISVGTLLFTEAVTRMERHGLLREVNGNKTAITKQGEINLFGLVLLGMIPDEQKRRLESKGVLGVAKSGDGRFDSVEMRGTALQAGDAGSSPAHSNALAAPVLWTNGKSPAVIDVAKQASGNPAFGLQVGSNGGGASPFLPSPPFPSDERFADNISRFVDRRMQ